MKALPQLDGYNPKWRGCHLIVIPFDPRMKDERDQLATQLVGQGYYLFVGRKEDVERFILKEGKEVDDGDSDPLRDDDPYKNPPKSGLDVLGQAVQNLQMKFAPQYWTKKDWQAITKEYIRLMGDDLDPQDRARLNHNAETVHG